MRTTLHIDPSQWPEIWQAAYRILEQSVVSTQLRAWIQPLELQKTETGESGLKIYFSAPNDFSAQWVRDHYQKEIENAFAQVTGAKCDILFNASEKPEAVAPIFEPPVESRSHAYALPESSPASGVVLSASSRASTSLSSNTEYQFDPRLTFDTFVVGSSNQFAQASAYAVAEQPAKQYNPLFLYSYPGLGKTHLLHAIANHVLAKNPNARVAYLSAERFVNELIESLQHNRMPQFRTKYRDSFDLILIDDIQFIAGKVKTEEEFFHTFNALHGSKRQIVVSSDRPPKEIEGLEERIRTRFEWGLVADISPPEIETRIAILKAKAERDDIYLPDDVATFLATYIKTNVRELEGVLIKLQAQASLTGAEMSLEMAKQQLKMAIPEEGSHFTIEAIQNAVAKHFHLKSNDFKSSTRTRAIARPRQIAMYLIRKYTGMGFKEIGHYFGGKDHTTIMHAYKQIEKGMDNDPSVRDAVESIQNLL
jgi:chromosomal replication initiator protein